MQKLLTLIVGGGILYMIFQQNINGIVPSSYIPLQKSPEQSAYTEEPADPDLSGNLVEKTLSKVLLNVLKTDNGRIFLETLLQPMNKSITDDGEGFSINSDAFINSIFKINTFDEGVKGPAACGHIVTAHYKILGTNNIILKEKIESFTLGDGKIAPGMDAVIVGMKIGQTRQATITNKYLPETASDKASSFKINVLLQNIMPENFIDDRVKIFDDQLAYRIPLVCGNKAIYDAKITRLSNGEVIYNSVDSGKKINMTIGNLTYPLIFSHALHNKIPIGTRTVITPGKFLKSYASANSTIFPDKTLSEDEFFMVEFFNFDKSILTENVNFIK